MHYTYLVDHGENAPSVGAGLDIQGGKLVSVSFYDVPDELDRLREALESIATLKTRNIEAHLVARAALNHEIYTAD